jgi:hypothetical protein
MKPVGTLLVDLAQQEQRQALEMEKDGLFSADSGEQAGRRCQHQSLRGHCQLLQPALVPLVEQGVAFVRRAQPRQVQLLVQ